jgi:pimeloyl-ACP methyl ester carboxylesterase
MGNHASMLVEQLAHASIYKPPVVDYRRETCLFATTRDGDSIAMRLYSKDPEVQQRFVSEEATESPYDLLIFSHGNGSDIGGMHKFCEHLCEALQMDVLVYDYPQYGHSSTTKVSECKILASIDAVFEASLQQGWNPSRMFLMGHSLGSVPTVHLACVSRVCGVMLLAPLASGSRVFLQDTRLVPRWLVGRLDFLLFDNVDKVAEIACPVAIVHGTYDTTVKVEHTEALKLRISESSRYTTLFVPLGHNDLVEAEGRELLRVTQYLRRFRDRCLSLRAASEKNDGRGPS